jgi:hypothetical protein
MVENPSFQPAPPQPERRSRSWLFVLIGGFLIAMALIGVGVGWLIYSRLTSSQSNIPALVGADTQFYATISPNLSALPGVARLQEAYPDLFLENESSNADNQLEQLLGVSFKDDVQPWVGTEMAVAVSGLKEFTLEGGSLSGDALSELARQAKVAIVLSSRDDEKARAFLDKQREHRKGEGQDFDESTYQDVTIYEQQEAESSPIAAFAQVRGFVVFASDKNTITAMIDRDPRGSETLASTERFKTLHASLPSTAVGYFYLNGSTLSDASTAMIEQLTSTMEPEQAERLEESLANVKALQALGASISVVDAGVQFDTAATFDLTKLSQRAAERLEETRQPVSAERLGTISRDALGLITFKIPSTLKDDVLDAIKAQPDGEQSLRDFEQQNGFDLEKDLLDWLVGEGSLVLMPGEKIGETTLPATAYLAIQPSDKAAAEAGMEKIAAAVEKLMGDSDQARFTDASLGGAEWQVIEDEQSSDPLFGYGFVGNDLVIGLGKGALTAAGNGKDTPITDSESFKETTAKLATPNGGVLYVNMSDVLDEYMSSGAAPEDFDDKNLRPIKAIGAAGAPGVTQEGVATSRMLVYIAK